MSWKWMSDMLDNDLIGGKSRSTIVKLSGNSRVVLSYAVAIFAII